MISSKSALARQTSGLSVEQRELADDFIRCCRDLSQTMPARWLYDHRGSELFEQIKLPLKRNDLHDRPVCWGGPLQPERGFILHTQPQAVQEDRASETAPHDVARWHYASSLLTSDGLQMTTSRDILEALSEGGGPAPLFAALGYSSWDRGQLEDEVRNNNWLTVPAAHALIFDTPLDMRYDRAIRLLGVAPSSLTMQAGTA